MSYSWDDLLSLTCLKSVNLKNVTNPNYFASQILLIPQTQTSIHLSYDKKMAIIFEENGARIQLPQPPSPKFPTLSPDVPHC